MDHIKNGQKYAVFMDRLKLYKEGADTTSSPRADGGE